MNPELVASFKQSLEALQGERAVEVARIGRMVFGRRDVIEDSEMFALPTLIAVGREDKPRPVFESYLMNDCITGSELVEIPEAGHISSLEQPEFVNQMLLNFSIKYMRSCTADSNKKTRHKPSFSISFFANLRLFTDSKRRMLRWCLKTIKQHNMATGRVYWGLNIQV